MNNYGLNDFQIREIVKNYEEKCNKEDILENSGITEEERENDDFIERVNQLYTELRNSAPDWGVYLAEAISQVRKEECVKSKNLAALYKKVYSLKKSANFLKAELDRVLPLITKPDEISKFQIVSLTDIDSVIKILETKLHIQDDFVLEGFFLFAPDRVEAFRKHIKYEEGFDDPENLYLEMSYEDFCKELDKGYGKSEYLQIARLYEDQNGLIWYDGDYVG